MLSEAWKRYLFNTILESSIAGVSFKAYRYHESCQHVRNKSHSALCSTYLALSPGK